MIDLHMHTVFSDGASQPEELVAACAAQNLEAIAVTDHDTTESLIHIQKAADNTGLRIIPGIEINTVWHYNGNHKEVHILGYFIDPNGDLLQEIIKKHQASRVVQLSEMAEKIRDKARIKLTFEDILAHSGQGTIGRPHVAKAIVEKGGAPSISDAFSRYLNPAASTYVRRQTAPPHEAVEAIYESGGIAVIAHPGEMEGIEILTKELMEYGLGGLEAYHKSHSPGVIEFHCSLAEELGLIVTGGTDFHGTGEAYAKALERVHMPPYVYEELQAEYTRRQKSMFKAS